jgi:hypothetical protein
MNRYRVEYTTKNGKASLVFIWEDSEAYAKLAFIHCAQLKGCKIVSIKKVEK